MRVFVNTPSEHLLYLTLFITNSGGWCTPA